MAYTPNLSRYWNYFANITKQNNNGYFIPKTGYFVVSGSVSSVMGGTTGSVSVNIDSYAIKLKRFEAFHSGSATSFDIVFQNATPNTGSSFDPRKVIVTYKNVAGSPDYTSGVDQI